MHRNLKNWISFLLIAILTLASVPATDAQDPDMTEPMQVSGKLLKLQYDVRPAGPPSIELLSDSRVVFSIVASGDISGDLQGTMTTTITEVHPDPTPPSQWFTSVFVVETDEGHFEGFYSGALYRPEGADAAEVRGEGIVLSVSGVYADLYRATVFVQGSVPYENGMGVGENGSMVIVPQ